MESDGNDPVGAPEADAPEEWRKGKDGHEYVPRQDGRPGRITRQGKETIEEARARDSASRGEQRRPRRKPKTPPKPPAPKKADLKELEHAIAEGLKAPAFACAAFGDEWGAEHFARTGPYLARNLVNAAQTNPWLRAKLEEAAAGEDAMVKVMGMLGVAGAAAMYLVPPVVYYLNLPVPGKAREMLQVPPRREREAPFPPPSAHAPEPSPEDFEPTPA